MGQQTKCPFHWCRKQVCSPRSHGGISMGRMRPALQQRLPVAAGAATLTVFLAAVILLPKTTSEILRDSAFDIELAGDQWLRRPAPSDLKVIVVDIDRASIDALGTWPWPRETMARLVEAVATGRHPDASCRCAPSWWVHFSRRPGLGIRSPLATRRVLLGF